MPFWWNRRRKPWYTNRWKRRKPFAYKRRKRQRYRRRRRPYGRRRRRRRRRYKVRKKLQKITIKQWQPDSITKCKIIGYGCLVAGAQGRQFYCYTNQIPEYIQPKAPGGGGFGAEMFSLKYLYQQWLARKNIWTKSNDYKDLVRYTGSVIKLYRHATTDFVVFYNRQPPFLIEKDYYNDLHPANLLLQKHKKIVPSLKRRPNAKPYVKLKIKPPKQMITKWFFQQDFADQGLFTLHAAAANFDWGYYGPNTESRLVTCYALNINFYKTTDWGKASSTPWYPYPHYPTTNPYTFHYPTKTGEGEYTPRPNSYNDSVNIDTGFFSTKVLSATKVTQKTQAYHERPVTIIRYNPDIDDGQGNAVWLTSIISNNNWDKPHDHDLIIVGKPIWMAFYGFYDFILKAKKDKAWLFTSMFVVKCPSIRLINKTVQDVFPIIDPDFINGKLPYGETISDARKARWYPQVENQLITINSFVQTGPFIPKYAFQKESTWELTYKYHCYFKWGGPHVTDEAVQNPKGQDKYPVPDTVTQGLQIVDPGKADYQAMLRAWDYRRGIVTTTALKRMSEHLQIDKPFSSDDSEPSPKKKKNAAEIPYYQEKTQKIQKCLLSLCEEDTCQETEDLHKLIQHQQQQQQKLKHNIIQLLIEMKTHQRKLQLQTGLE
nr:MAG: ORF1 [Torque teno midi virus]